LGAVFAGASGDVAPKFGRAPAGGGTAEDGSLIPPGERVRLHTACSAKGERVPLHTACYVNAAASIAFDYDDYLFAGHTGHSAVLGALAFGEAAGAAGADVITAQVVANEVGGRLGAALLLGPHN